MLWAGIRQGMSGRDGQARCSLGNSNGLGNQLVGSLIASELLNLLTFSSGKDDVQPTLLRVVVPDSDVFVLAEEPAAQ